MNKFNFDELQEPPAIHWPGYFWILNDRVDENKLVAQLREMRAQDARSVCLLPEPPEFRPDSLATRLDRPYLSKPYFDMIRVVVKECERLGMNYWLYDEGGWPSGGACGQVYKQNPKAFAQKVCIPSETGPKVVETSGGTAPYPDLLNPDVTKTFIQLTHEGYKKSVGDHFGKTIRFAFTDEPSVAPLGPGRLTWTDDLEKIFKARKGYDLMPGVPDLLKEPSPSESPELTQMRIDFQDVRSQLFVERYLLPLRDWCRKNNLLSAGHMGGEDEPIGNAYHGYGHILRALRGLDLPGIDVIWRQLFPGLRSHHFPKYASSVARQMGQPLVLTESFAVYGNGTTPGQMKWLTDQQFVRGASLMVGSAYPYSTCDHFLAGERPHFGPDNPLWKYMDLYHRYTARLSYLLTRGDPVCSTAVYFDIRSIWAGGKYSENAIRLHDTLAEKMLTAQCEFDYIDDDLLAGRGASMDQGTLAVGPMRYDTIVVPATQWMDPEALKNLAQFVSAGGKLIAVDGLPASGGGKNNLLNEVNKEAINRISQVGLDAVSSLLNPLVSLEPACPDIRVCRRTWEDTAFYFLTNEAERNIRLKVNFPWKGIPIRIDLETGRRCELPAMASAKGTTVELEFAPWESCAILLGDKHETLRPEFIPDRAFTLPENGWTLQPIRQFRIGEREIEVIDLKQETLSAALGDWSPYLGSNFSGDVQYTLDFQCDPHQAAQPARLDLGKVNYVCQVFLNDRDLGRRIWRPFTFDLGDALRPGKNQLRIIVTNTLANTLLDPAVSAEWDRRKGVTWPVDGAFIYDLKARQFERDSLPSGLFGPVKLEAAG